MEFVRRLRKFFCLERATIVRAQGASEDKKFAAKPTQPNAKFDTVSGIKLCCLFLLVLTSRLVANPLESPSAPPATACIPFPSKYSIEADMLYWKADEGGLSYALEERKGHLDEDVIVKNPQFEWDFGFKLGFDYLLPQDRWDISLKLTLFHTHTDAQHRAKGKKILYPIWITEQTPLSADTIKMHWRLHLGLIDALIGKKVHPNARVILYPQLGLRYAIARQKFNLEYQGGMFLPEREESVRMKNKFSGIGPCGVLGIQYPFSSCFSLCASGGLSAVYGEFYLHEDEDLTIGHVKLLGILHTFRRMAFIADGSVFLRWQKNWEKSKNRLNIQIGWDAMLLFKQNRLIRFFETSPIDNPGNLGLKGWQWGVLFDF